MICNNNYKTRTNLIDSILQLKMMAVDIQIDRPVDSEPAVVLYIIIILILHCLQNLISLKSNLYLITVV